MARIQCSFRRLCCLVGDGPQLLIGVHLVEVDLIHPVIGSMGDIAQRSSPSTLGETFRTTRFLSYHLELHDRFRIPCSPLGPAGTLPIDDTLGILAESGDKMDH